MKIFKKSIGVVFAILTFYNVQAQGVGFEETTSFYPTSETLQKDTIVWGYLTIPENWEDPESSIIKVAVCVLKNTSNSANADSVVFIQGGPGAGGIQNIWSWRNHPLRQKNDIVLFDVRGTGFSKPRLCPDLGEQLLEILSKNQSKAQDEQQKTMAALSCKTALLNKGIDVEAYHSLSVAKDLNTLKNQLGYANWNVYGVSYGTYMAQVYASTYPDDIKTVTLDSSIPDITTYYTQNTSNYINSLTKIFELCKNDAQCNSEYPDLEKVYYKTIADLEKNPITVSVDREVLESEEFTYNAEDFKVAVQQALYHKQLIEIIPVLIYQFKERNEEALGNLVAAFSNLLGMDYGVYYCVSCNETLPNNSIAEYQKNVSRYPRLKGGISFYESDFKVCKSWNLTRTDSIAHHDTSQLADLSAPVLVFAGEHDPITPQSNGKKTARKFKNATAIIGSTYGHVPSFTQIGNQVAAAFINNPHEKIEVRAFEKAKRVHLTGGVTMNSGISKMGNSLNQVNPIFLAPLCIAIGIMVVFAFVYAVKLLRKKYTTNQDRIIRMLSILISTIGVVGLVSLVSTLLKVAGKNYFILAFGLPDNFSYIFTLLFSFIALLLVALLYFVLQLKKISDRSIVFSVLFSNMLLVTYLLYWGIV